VKASRKGSKSLVFFGLFRGRVWYNSEVEFHAQVAFGTCAFFVRQLREKFDGGACQ
jgi:hypothetical protein